MVIRRTALLACALALIGTETAAAVPDCAGVQPKVTVLGGQGSMESVIGGPDGKLYYTDQDRRALMRLDEPAGEPTVVADGIEAPGGLLVSEDRKAIIVGYGDSIVGAATGNLDPQAGLYRVEIATGEKTELIAGLSMANGVARDAAGVMYASNDVTYGIDRIENGTVQLAWSPVVSANGLAVDRASRYLYANQTFVPAAIARVDLTTGEAQTFARPGAEDLAAGLDGMTIDQDDRIFSAANNSGELWRTDQDRTICAVARQVQQPSAVAFGPGGVFPETSLYAVSFAGVITEVPQARPQPPELDPAAVRLKVTVTPKRLKARRRTRITITVTRDGRPEQGARVSVGKRTKTTGARGRARLRVKPRRAGRLRILVSAGGVKPVVRSLKVRRADRAPRPRAQIG